MLKDIHRRSMIEMKLGIRQHGALLAGQAGLVAKVFKRDRECCHVCGYRIPGHMEIDHVAGHRRGVTEGDLRTICQFCHNLRHPIWAASRSRMVPIHAPDLSQSDLHRLAWTLLAWRDVENGPIDEGAVTGAIDMRRSIFLERFGCQAADALLEAACGLPDLKTGAGKKIGGAAVGILARVDQSLRFWPTELLPMIEEFDAGCRVSTWGIGGFQVIAESAAEAIRADQDPDFERIGKAARLAIEKAREVS